LNVDGRWDFILSDVLHDEGEWDLREKTSSGQNHEEHLREDFELTQQVTAHAIP